MPGGRQIARHFRRKIDAERWLTEQQSRVNRGDWTAPELGRIAVSEWAETWLASKKTLKGRTYTSYESVWRTLVKPRGAIRALIELPMARSFAGLPNCPSGVCRRRGSPKPYCA